MSLRARILLVVLGVMPLLIVLIVLGITQEVLRARQSAQGMRRLLVEEAAERLYSVDLRSATAQFPPEMRELALGSVLDRLDARQQVADRDRLLESWAIFWADGQLAAESPRAGERDGIADDPEGREAALGQDGPVAMDETVWRRLVFGSGEEARAVAVIAMRFRLDFSSFDLIRQLYLILAISGIGTLTLAILLWLLLERMVVGPVDRLAEAARRVREGDYDHRVPAFGRSDELSHFIQVFNEMLVSIRDSRKNLESQVAAATEQVRASEKRLAVASRLAATGRLAAEIAHEINNPVGGMINAARMLKTRVESGKLDRDRAVDYLELILDGLSRVERTVKEVLLFARREVRAHSFTISTPVERALALVRHRGSERGISIETVIQPDLPAIWGDGGELQQVLINLLINAIDASPDNQPVELTARPGAGGGVEVLVVDHGAGMTPEVREHAFDPFYTTKAEGEGTGIGLAVVYNIISSHGGEIELVSTEDEGTTVRITLPAEPS